MVGCQLKQCALATMAESQTLRDLYYIDFGIIAVAVLFFFVEFAILAIDTPQKRRRLLYGFSERIRLMLGGTTVEYREVVTASGGGSDIPAETAVWFEKMRHKHNRKLAYLCVVAAFAQTFFALATFLLLWGQGFTLVNSDFVRQYAIAINGVAVTFAFCSYLHFSKAWRFLTMACVFVAWILLGTGSLFLMPFTW
jgi:hypothetical protein